MLPASAGEAVLDGVDGDRIAFSPYWHDDYHFVDRAAVVTGERCGTWHPPVAPGPVSLDRRYMSEPCRSSRVAERSRYATVAAATLSAWRFRLFCLTTRVC